MITLDLSTNAAAILAKLRALPARMATNIAAAMDKQNEKTIAHAQRHYLTGPRPQKLGVRTNRLRSSLTAAPARVAGSQVISAIGTNVEYAGVHERGIDKEVTVRAHKRNIFRTHQTGGGAVFDMKTGKIKRVKPKKVSLLQGQATVRSFTRKMKLPARPFLRPAIEDSRLAYAHAVSRAIERAWTGGSS